MSHVYLPGDETVAPSGFVPEASTWPPASYCTVTSAIDTTRFIYVTQFEFDALAMARAASICGNPSAGIFYLRKNGADRWNFYARNTAGDVCLNLTDIVTLSAGTKYSLLLSIDNEGVSPNNSRMIVNGVEVFNQAVTVGTNVPFDVVSAGGNFDITARAAALSFEGIKYGGARIAYGYNPVWSDYFDGSNEPLDWPNTPIGNETGVAWMCRTVAGFNGNAPQVGTHIMTGTVS